MRPPRIRSSSLTSSLLSIVNRCARPFGVEVTRHPAPTTLDWHIRALIDYEAIDCLFDVGANRGQFARRLRRLGYRGWILSFEPVPAAYEELSRVMAGDERWRGFEMALGHENATRSLNVAHGDAQASSFLDFNDHGPKRWGRDHTVKETIDVPVRRLDDIWDECTRGIDARRVFLKMDCQGYDLNVLAGTSKKIDRVRAIQSELALEHFYDGMTDFASAVRKIEELGYDAVGFFPLARREPDYLRLVEMDCLFLKCPGE